MPNKKKKPVRKQHSQGDLINDCKTISLLRRTASKAEADAKRYARKVQLVVLGARNVGKSAILSQYLFRTFETKYRPTVDEFYVHMVQMEDGTYLNLHLIDTAGPHDFPAMQRLWIQQSSAFMVVYNVCDQTSFDAAADILRQIYEEKNVKEFHAVLVGNKADILDKERVSRESVRALSNKYACLYIETSAKHGLNIESLFRCLIMKEVVLPNLPQYRYSRQSAVEADGVKPTFFCAKKK